ncbi:DAK2 domain-containing protein [Cellulomonas sp. P22]|uniref:DAK2 domain-containing protein n=1 Tax=Cellulomonas sp. P22 TaxID=3373189 RepID=UPI0037928232
MERLDGTAVRAWALAAQVALDEARDRIDAVNVFPVADSDTGTNVHLTVGGGAAALGTVPVGAGAHEVARAFARGALLAARGNSGIIVSQYLAGFAAALPDDADAAQLAAALGAASRAATGAVADPQEGTVLTLARSVAQVAADAVTHGGADSDGLVAVLRPALREAHASLGAISEVHPVLRASHVLDAGACGLLVVLDALARAVEGRAHAPADLAWLPTAAGPRDDRHDPGGPGADGHHAHGHGAGGHPEGEGAFEVMLLVRSAADEDLGPALRERMRAVGDSVAVVGDDGLWNVHVHTDDPARAIEQASCGAREQVVVRLLASRTGTGGAGGPGAGAVLGVVACTGTSGLAAAHASTGAVAVVRCDGTGVGVRHLVRAITDTGAPRVVVLPGDAETAEAARAAAHALEPTGVHVSVAEDALDELRVLVGVLALQGSGAGDLAGRLEACRGALRRLRGTELARPEPDEVQAALDALLAQHEGDPESLTVLLGTGSTAEVGESLVARTARDHPGLAVLVAGPVDGLPAVWLGVD